MGITALGKLEPTAGRGWALLPVLGKPLYTYIIDCIYHLTDISFSPPAAGIQPCTTGASVGHPGDSAQFAPKRMNTMS